MKYYAMIQKHKIRCKYKVKVYLILYHEKFVVQERKEAG